MDAQRRKLYARYRGNAGSSRRAAPVAKRDYRETILTQCIVSGLILTVALMLNVLDIPFASSLRTSLKKTISEETTVENLMEMTTNISGRMNSVKDSIKTIFGGTGVEGDLLLPDTEKTAPAKSELTTSPQPTANPTDSRIDEDILKEINQSTNLQDPNIKKSAAPTEITTSELLK